MQARLWLAPFYQLGSNQLRTGTTQHGSRISGIKNGKKTKTLPGQVWRQGWSKICILPGHNYPLTRGLEKAFTGALQWPRVVEGLDQSSSLHFKTAVAPEDVAEVINMKVVYTCWISAEIWNWVRTVTWGDPDTTATRLVMFLCVCVCVYASYFWEKSPNSENKISQNPNSLPYQIIITNSLYFRIYYNSKYWLNNYKITFTLESGTTVYAGY